MILQCWVYEHCIVKILPLIIDKIYYVIVMYANYFNWFLLSTVHHPQWSNRITLSGHESSSFFSKEIFSYPCFLYKGSVLLKLFHNREMFFIFYSFLSFFHSMLSPSIEFTSLSTAMIKERLQKTTAWSLHQHYTISRARQHLQAFRSERCSGAGVTNADQFQRFVHGVDLCCAPGSDLILKRSMINLMESFCFPILLSLTELWSVKSRKP